MLGFLYLFHSYAFKTIAGEHTLKNWEVHGSLDGLKWLKIGSGNENLCEGSMGLRNDNVSVCNTSKEVYFDLENEGIFRYIRVTQIGRNTETDEQHNRDNFGYTFYLHAFELYGKIFNCFITRVINFKSFHFSLLFCYLVLS